MNRRNALIGNKFEEMRKNGERECERCQQNHSYEIDCAAVAVPRLCVCLCVYEKQTKKKLSTKTITMISVDVDTLRTK